MVNLNFLEEIADKASLILPTVYLPIVEECTAPDLQEPKRNHIMFLQEKIRVLPEDCPEVIRAIRRRLRNDDPHVRSLTLDVLNDLIREGTPVFHHELSTAKGLLREVENIANATQHSPAWKEARIKARQLILNLNAWFLRHPNPSTHIFTTLITSVREVSGPTSFAGLTPDMSVRLEIPLRAQDAAAPRSTDKTSAGVRPTRGPQSQEGSTAARESVKPAPQRRSQRIVEAIPVNLPTEEIISEILDSCATLAEYLPNAEVHPKTGAFVDEVVSSFHAKLNDNANYLTLLLSSDIEEIDRDVIRSLLDNIRVLSNTVNEGRPKSSTAHQDPNAMLPPEHSAEPFQPRAAATTDGVLDFEKPAVTNASMERAEKLDESPTRSEPRTSGEVPSADSPVAKEEEDILESLLGPPKEITPQPPTAALVAAEGEVEEKERESSSSPEQDRSSPVVIEKEQTPADNAKDNAEVDDLDEYLNKELGE